MKEEEERKIKEEEERKRKMKEEEERKMKEEKKRKIKEEEERERKMKEEEERKMKEEKERKMKEEKERKMKEERERKIKEEEERKMKEEKERKMKEEKERKIKEEEERKIKEEEERKMKEEKERKMKEEEERKMKEEKERKMKEEKERKMKEEEERKMKEERKRKMKEEEERKMKEERERKMKEEEERKMKEEKKRKDERGKGKEDKRRRGKEDKRGGRKEDERGGGKKDERKREKTMYSSEEELASRRGHHSSDPETDLSTSDSGVPHYPASSKCRPMVIESEDEDSQDDAISGVYLRRKRRKRKMDGGSGSQISGDESEIQMMSESHDPDMIDALILPRSDSDSEDEMVVEENTSNCIGSSKENAPKSSESASQTQVTATTRSQECQMLRLSHLGPVALFDQPRFRKKPAPAPMPTAMQTPIPAGPEYVEKLFSSLHQRIERSSVDLTQNSHATQPQGTINSRAAGTASLSQTCLNQPVRGIDYQGQSPVLLPNMYGTLQPVPATEKPKPISRNNSSLCTPGHSWEAPHSALPGSSHVVSSTEQIQPNPTYNHPNPVAEKLHNTFGTSQVTPLQPQASHNQNPQYSYASVPNCSLQQMPWLPKIRPERVTHGKQQETLAIEDLEEALEEVLATRLCSKWWVMGLQQLCASINTKILPYFLRLVLKCIMCADPLEPQKHPNSLPPKLYRLFQVVCIMEQRLTPHHPRGLHNALLRAIQAIISKPDIKITLHSLASLTAWYIASASIDGQAKAGQEWRRARTFLVDLLFHHPGAIHLALLTAATTSYRIFCKFMQHRVMSGLEQVVVWLAHYGAWVGQPGVRSDLTKWLAQHLKVKKPPQSPAPLIKNLVTLLDPEKKRDLQWGAATSIVVLARWQGWAWTREHLLPPLLTAAGEISMAVSQQEESCNRDLELNEDFNIKISHLFDNLSQALPCGPEEKDYDDIVEKMKNAVTSIFCSSPSANCNILTT
ncbi:hypothetical protein O3P69_002803 [Scylla paramamosain]|uniref:Uncharacterized protein n=1 Tax=Scylla paramamosain TaxID=85552 RepID=A0AAW0UNT3_SCYPA